MNPILLKLWAKSEPFHPLPCHLIDAGNVALALLDTVRFRTIVTRFACASGCPEEQVKPWLAYLISFHDLGKCHRRFQSKADDDCILDPLIDAGLLQESKDEPFRHEVVSAQWVRRYLQDHHSWPKPATRTVAAALRAHHGDFQAEEDKVEESDAELARWEPLRQELAAMLFDVFRPAPWTPSIQDHSVTGVLLCGLLVLSDWIASNTDLFSISYIDESLDEYLAKSSAIARQAVQRLGFSGAALWKSGETFQEVWPGIESPNSLQHCIEELVHAGVLPGLAIIEAPMGEGKTEAAIYFATRRMVDVGESGMYFALPTSATSNQMYGRVQEFLSNRNPQAALTTRLVHGTAWLLDEASPQRLLEVHGATETDGGLALDWFRPTRRALLALNGVGTIDQAHLSVLHVRFGFLRLLGLVGKVLILDEVHAYDAFMSEFLEHLLRWCSALHVPVILLSATLPARKREALMQAYSPGSQLSPAPYPLITVVDHKGALREESEFATTPRPTVRLVQHQGYLGEPERIASVVAERARQGGCIGVIASTVNSAQAIFQALQRALADEHVELILFHARFMGQQRQELERVVLERLDKRSLFPDRPDYKPRPERLVLVATQILEQSLDLDFDEMFTELAPIDLLLQRMGRLWRHLNRTDRKGRENPCLHLFLPDNGGSLKPAADVYSGFVLKKTQEVLATRQAINLPDDLRDLVEQVYDDPPTGDSPLWKDWQLLQAEWAEDKLEAQALVIPDPKPSSFVLGNFRQPSRNEHDEQPASYLAVRTRKGDYTRSVVALEGDVYRELLAASHPPDRDVLRAIYLQSVSLPSWWLSRVEPETGHEPLESAPNWLPGYSILRLKGGRWEGVTASGEPFAILADTVLGFMRVDRKGA